MKSCRAAGDGDALWPAAGEAETPEMLVARPDLAHQAKRRRMDPRGVGDLTPSRHGSLAGRFLPAGASIGSHCPMAGGNFLQGAGLGLGPFRPEATGQHRGLHSPPVRESGGMSHLCFSGRTASLPGTCARGRRGTCHSEPALRRRSVVGRRHSTGRHTSRSKLAPFQNLAMGAGSYGLAGARALSSLASLTRALSSFFWTLATSPGSMSRGEDLANSSRESCHWAAARRMRPVFS